MSTDFAIHPNRPPSKLLYATLLEMQSAQAAKNEAVETSNAPNSSKAATKSDFDKTDFELSTHQLIRLVSRYRMDKFDFKTLQSMPLADLSPQERNFINFLRRNRPIFDRIARLDKDPETLSITDLKLAAQLAGDSMVLSSEDLNYLYGATQTDKEEANRRAENGETQETQTTSIPRGRAQEAVPQNSNIPTVANLEALLTRISQLNTSGLNRPVTPFTTQTPRLTLSQLQTIPQSQLTEQEIMLLAYLQSPAVFHMLQQIADSNDGMITVDTIRILMSLISNPMLMGTMPIVFFKKSVRDPKSLLESKHEEEKILDADQSSGELNSLNKTKQTPKREYHIQADDILAICHEIHEEGQISLSELRKYKPRNKREAKIMKLLGKSSIFHRLSSLDHHDETLSDEDIRLAVASKALVLSDSSMVLVVLP
jgi:hypothetical protein